MSTRALARLVMVLIAALLVAALTPLVADSPECTCKMRGFVNDDSEPVFECSPTNCSQGPCEGVEYHDEADAPAGIMWGRYWRGDVRGLSYSLLLDCLRRLV